MNCICRALEFLTVPVVDKCSASLSFHCLIVSTVKPATCSNPLCFLAASSASMVLWPHAQVEFTCAGMYAMTSSPRRRARWQIGAKRTVFGKFRGFRMVPTWTMSNARSRNTRTTVQARRRMANCDAICCERGTSTQIDRDNKTQADWSEYNSETRDTPRRSGKSKPPAKHVGSK